MTLEEYLEFIERIRNKHENENNGTNDGTDEKEKDLVAALSLTRNQLTFVIADSAKNVIQGPWSSMLSLGTDESSLSSGRQQYLPEDQYKKLQIDIQANTQKFHREFWSQIVEDLFPVSSDDDDKQKQQFLDRCACFWFRSTRDVSHPFFYNCVSTTSTEEEENNKKSDDEKVHQEQNLLIKRQELRNDPRWLKLPSHIAKGKKACVDVDSLLRDMHIGFVKLFH